MNLKIKLLIIVCLFILIYIVPSQACIVNWLADNETYISLKNTNKSFDINKVKESLGKDYFNEENDSITFNCVNRENCSILISKKEMIFKFYNIKTSYEMYYIYNLTSQEIDIELNKNKKLTNKTCNDHLTWIKSINATNLDEMDIDQICKAIDLRSYVDYGHKHQIDAEVECVNEIIGNYSIDFLVNHTIYDCTESCKKEFSREKCGITINLTSSPGSECPPGYRGDGRITEGRLEYLECINDDCFIKKKIDCFCRCDSRIKECYDTIFKDKWISLYTNCVIKEGEKNCYACGGGGAGKFFSTPKNTKSIPPLTSQSGESEQILPTPTLTTTASETHTVSPTQKATGFEAVASITIILFALIIRRKRSN
jgi:hypothetical protein